MKMTLTDIPVFEISRGFTARMFHTEGPTGKLRLSDGGSGPGVPVLFVHGLGASLSVWEAQLDFLRPKRRAVALDLRGHGKSEVPRDGDYRMEAMARDVLTAADALRLPHFILAGHSMGGVVVAEVARLQPHRVTAVLQESGLHRVLPELPRLVMTGVGHWLMMDDPQTFNRLMDEFLAALPPLIAE